MKSHLFFILFAAFCFSLNAQDGQSSQKATDKNSTTKKQNLNRGKKITSDDKVAEYNALKNKQAKSTSGKNTSGKTKVSSNVQSESELGKK